MTHLYCGYHGYGQQLGGSAAGFGDGWKCCDADNGSIGNYRRNSIEESCCGIVGREREASAERYVDKRDNNSNIFMTMVNIDPRDDKAVPIADIVFFTNKSTLADHYRLIGDVLSEIRKKDNTSWIWNKVKIELNDLAKKVERDLVNYNVEGAGIAFVIDNDCSYLCNVTCGSGFAILCLAGGILGGLLVGAICGVSTSVGCTAICGEVCNEPVDWMDLGCAGGCQAFFITPVCSKLEIAAPICEKFMANIGICTLICDQVGGIYGG